MIDNTQIELRIEGKVIEKEIEKLSVSGPATGYDRNG